MAIRKQSDPKWQEAGRKAARTRKRNLELKQGDTKSESAAQKVESEDDHEERAEHKRGEHAAIHASSVSTCTLQATVNYDLRHIIKSQSEQAWVTKYRPTSLSQCIGEIIGYFKAMVKTGSIPLGLVLFGFFGTGKTVVARCFVRDYYVARGVFRKDATFEQVAQGANTTREYQGMFPPVLYLNAAQFRGGCFGKPATEEIVMRIRNFMQYGGGLFGANLLRFVVCDEADLLGFAVQDAISSSLEKHNRTRVIWATNYIDQIRDRIVSRCAGGVFEFKKPNDKELMTYLRGICVQERVKLPDAKLLEIVKTAPGVRDAVGILQREAVLVMQLRK